MYDASSYVVTSLDLPTVSRVAMATPSRPYLSLMLALAAEDMTAGIADGDVPDAPPCPTSEGGAYWRAPMTEGLLESVLRLVHLLDEPRAIPFLGPPREREVLYQLLTGAQGTRLSRARPRPATSPAIVRQAAARA